MGDSIADTWVVCNGGVATSSFDMQITLEPRVNIWATMCPRVDILPKWKNDLMSPQTEPIPSN